MEQIPGKLTRTRRAKNAPVSTLHTLIAISRESDPCQFIVHVEVGGVNGSPVRNARQGFLFEVCAKYSDHITERHSWPTTPHNYLIQSVETAHKLAAPWNKQSRQMCNEIMSINWIYADWHKRNLPRINTPVQKLIKVAY